MNILTISHQYYLIIFSIYRKKGSCRDCFKQIELHNEEALGGLSIHDRIAHLDRSNRCYTCEQENPVIRKIDPRLLEKFSSKDEILPYPVGTTSSTTTITHISSLPRASTPRNDKYTTTSGIYATPDLCSLPFLTSKDSERNKKHLLEKSNSSASRFTNISTTTIDENKKLDDTLQQLAELDNLSEDEIFVQDNNNNNNSDIDVELDFDITPESSTPSPILSTAQVVVESPNKWAILRAKLTEKEKKEPIFAYVSYSSSSANTSMDLNSSMNLENSTDYPVPTGTIVRVVEFFTPVVIEYLDDEGEMLRADIDPDHLIHIHPRQVYSGNVIKLFQPTHVLHINVNEGERYFVLSKPNVENSVFCVHSRSMMMGYAPYDIFYMKDYFGTPVKMTPYNAEKKGSSLRTSGKKDDSGSLNSSLDLGVSMSADDLNSSDPSISDSMNTSTSTSTPVVTPSSRRAEMEFKILTIRNRRKMLSTAGRISLASLPNEQ